MYEVCFIMLKSNQRRQQADKIHISHRFSSGWNIILQWRKSVRLKNLKKIKGVLESYKTRESPFWGYVSSKQFQRKMKAFGLADSGNSSDADFMSHQPCWGGTSVTKLLVSHMSSSSPMLLWVNLINSLDYQANTDLYHFFDLLFCIYILGD